METSVAIPSMSITILRTLDTSWITSCSSSFYFKFDMYLFSTVFDFFTQEKDT